MCACLDAHAGAYHFAPDTFILSSKFSNYVINSNDENLVNLKKMFYYKIHPLEVRKIFTMFSKFKG